MTFKAPSAPESFYEPTLTAMIARLTGTARLVLIDSETLDPSACWSAVGVAADSDDVTGANIGTSVLAYAPLGVPPVANDGDPDPEGTTEYSRKLVFTAVADVPVVQTKSGTALAIALVDDVATQAGGTNANVAYIVDLQDLALDGTGGGATVNVPSFEIEIQYAVNKP